MPSYRQPDAGFRFSLRTLLIVLVSVGVGIGLLGRLMVRNPEMGLGVLSLLCTVIPYLMAIGTIIWVGVRSKPARSIPSCGRCKTDLRWMSAAQASVCPDCGVDLAEPNAIRFVPGPRRRQGLIIWGLVLLVMPLAGMGVTFLAYTFLGSSPSSLGVLSNQQLIQQRLPQELDAPWVWNELERRLNAGTLTQKEVDSAIARLTAHMKNTKPNGWDSPLSWQGGFVRSANQAGMISDPELFALCDAFYGPNPVIPPLPRLREGDKRLELIINYGSTWGSNSGVGMALLWELKQVQLDGKPIEVKLQYKNGEDWSGHYEGPLPAGDHKLTATVEYAYVDQDKLIGLDADRLPASRWPKSRQRGTKTVTVPFTVYTANAAIVQLTTDLGKAPGVTGAVEIERFVVQSDKDGKKKVILRVKYADGIAMPLSCDVVAVIQGTEVQLGRLWVSPTPDSRSSGGSNLEGIIDAIDPSIELADVILRPNPTHIEHRPEVTEIWGKEILLKSVPLERLDLETQ